jgi:hypothetical protein
MAVPDMWQMSVILKTVTAFPFFIVQITDPCRSEFHENRQYRCGTVAISTG